jgi:hypothetical protein
MDKPLDLRKRLLDLEDQRLAELSESELLATINQKKYMAHLKWQHERKNRNRRFGRRRRFQR